MADIIEFRCVAARRAACTRPDEAQKSADILFFPGVRYQRWEEPGRSQQHCRRGRRRDTLELSE